jgi:hypothetical protein
MAKSQVEDEAFVICWHSERTGNWFALESGWSAARERFEDVVGALCLDEDIEQVRASYGTIEPGGIVPTASRPVGLFCCPEGRSGTHNLFVIAHRPGTLVHQLGSRSDLELRLQRLPGDASVERFRPQDQAAFEAERRIPPSDMKGTPKAKRCLEAILAGSEIRDVSWPGHEELI